MLKGPAQQHLQSQRDGRFNKIEQPEKIDVAPMV
jgi:hypothetical protein